MKLVIERSRWWRGQSSDWSFLLNNDKKMCCLGFLSLACGLGLEDIREVRTVAKVETALPESLHFLLHVNETDVDSSDMAVRLMDANDRQGLTEERREALLTELFATQDIQVEFVD